MIIKIVVVLLLVVIIYCMGSAMFFMLSKSTPPESMVKALTWRIGLSLAVFILLMIGFLMGWLAPHNLIQTP